MTSIVAPENAGGGSACGLGDLYGTAVQPRHDRMNDQEG